MICALFAIRFRSERAFDNVKYKFLLHYVVCPQISTKSTILIFDYSYDNCNNNSNAKVLMLEKNHHNLTHVETLTGEVMINVY